jgi:hypothetical protein
MSKYARSNTPSIVVCIQPKSDEYAEQTRTLKKDLELIARKTVVGGITPLTLLMWQQLVLKCQERFNKFAAIDEVTDSLADDFERFVKAELPRR